MFIKESILRQSYVAYEKSQNKSAPPYITLPGDLELGIVSSKTPQIALGVSSILTRSLEDTKNSNGGYIPDRVVERVQKEVISPYGVAYIWGEVGHRFVLTAPAGGGMREIVASILVARSKDSIFFFTGMYNNLRHSSMSEDIDLNIPDPSNPSHGWFERFSFPSLELFKPERYHHIANFVVTKEHRGKRHSQKLLHGIVQNYSRDHLLKYGIDPCHSQHLLCGKGLWQIGDPPWLTKMEKLGFWLRAGAESFFIDNEWAPLDPIYHFGEKVENVSYNEKYGLTSRYSINDFSRVDPSVHLLKRVGHVKRLAQSSQAKLQYFQACFHFTKNQTIQRGR